MNRIPWYRQIFSSPPQFDLATSRKRAELGDADAQFGMGVKCGIGYHEAQDLAQAVQWYRMAAEQNHCLAQFNLAVMFASGQGAPRDDAAAVTWFRRAAEGGDGGAQFALGVRYHRSSVGTLQMDMVESRIEAYKWLRLAVLQGYKGSDAALERVAIQMSREEVTDGNARVAAFVVRG
jgi:TPR repeat protein